MLLRLFNEDVDLINHSHPDGKKSNDGSKGSAPAENDALELQKRIENSTEDASDLPEQNGKYSFENCNATTHRILEVPVKHSLTLYDSRQSS